MEATAHARFQRFGVRKVSQVLAEIRGKKVLEAEQLLPMVPRGCGRMIEKTLKSAASNLAVKVTRAGRTLQPEKVYVKQCWATMGPMGHMKRVMPGPQGRASTFKRKVCHVTVVVSDEPKTNGKR